MEAAVSTSGGGERSERRLPVHSAPPERNRRVGQVSISKRAEMIFLILQLRRKQDLKIEEFHEGFADDGSKMRGRGFGG